MDTQVAVVGSRVEGGRERACVCVNEREREKEREGDRQTDRPTERQKEIERREIEMVLRWETETAVQRDEEWWY